ncbi:MAG: ethylbenzene dehydrogenase-related protein [Desulfobacterales bacterium]
MNRMNLLVSVLIFSFATPAICWGDQTILAGKVNAAPVIDGNSNDTEWENTSPIVTHDRVAGIDVSLSAVYTDEKLFFLVEFPDPTESRSHKPWIWDKNQETYIMGSDRGDCFVFKWNMSQKLKDLRVNSDEPYRADIWFWKAGRTDPGGYADDKMQVLSLSPSARAVKLISQTGRIIYLNRTGDTGASAYRNKLHIEFSGDRLPQYVPQTPTGSRADIKAKGHWSKGRWILEFSRKRDTGHNDDIQFTTGKRYLFGISRYEIAGRAPDPNTTQPLYGAGDISENLILEFGR